jgi:hypothetical protein
VDQRRLIEACALLPLLHVAAGETVVACSGPQAEVFAAEVLRWPDVVTVYIRTQPRLLKDKRLRVVPPPVGSCDVVICSPNEDPTPVLHALNSDGVLSASTAIIDRVPALMEAMRALFRSPTPWREWLPEPLYGALASPSGTRVTRQRHPPPAVQRLSAQYLPCLFTFGKDELPLMLPRDRHGKPPQQSHQRPKPGATADAAGPTVPNPGLP